MQKGVNQDQLSLNEAWYRYADAYKESRRIFGEYLEFIGGLALRSRGLDERICCIADELIRKCSLEGTGSTWHSLTVIAPKESFTRTMARIVRLRFPEWSIWALPFTAHEYGHVVVGDPDSFRLRRLLEGEVNRLAQNDDEYQAAKDDQARERIKERIKKHVDVLFADAFATYTMGPAYACAAIYLRFDPSNAGAETEELPSDNRRAHIVFKTLKRINEEAGANKINLVYTPVIEVLEEHWKQMLERAGSASALSEWEVDNQAAGKQGAQSEERDEAEERKMAQRRLERDQQFDVIWEALKPPHLLKKARYPAEGGEEGWERAKMWAVALQKGLEGAGEEVPLATAGKLRDVLNAAWLCRLNAGAPEQVKLIARNALKLCQRIIAQQRASQQELLSSKSGDRQRNKRQRP
jgi:hypothetical protein